MERSCSVFEGIEFYFRIVRFLEYVGREEENREVGGVMKII